MTTPIEEELGLREKSDRYDLVGLVIGSAMKVHTTLGPGFLESVYKKALVHELRKSGFQAEIEQRSTVMYDGIVVGEFIADIIVDHMLVAELKAIENLCRVHEVQVVNYLTATGLDHGLLLNFGKQSLEFRRKFRTRASP